MSNYDLRDAFQELVALNEAEEFNLSDEEQIKKMADFMDGDEYDEVQMVIDVDAEGMDELEPSYEGKIILQCPVCKSLIYKDEADIVEDSESDYVNVEDHCPYCKEEGGMLIVGKVAPYPTHEEGKVEEPAEDSAEEVEAEAEGEEDKFDESLTEGIKALQTYYDDELSNKDAAELWRDFKDELKEDDADLEINLKDVDALGLADDGYLVHLKSNDSYKWIIGGNGEWVVMDSSESRDEFTPLNESLTEEVGVQKFGDEDDPERYHSANWYIGGRNNFELSTDALGGAKRGDAVRYTASRWSHTYHNTQEMEDDIKNLQTLIAEVKKLEAKGFVNSELNESLKEDLTVDEQAKVNEIVDQFLRDACAEIAVRDIDYKKENILKAAQAFVDDFFFMSESLNEDVNGELAMAELKDLVAMHIYNRFLESFDDNMAQEIAHRIPEYDVDWCNEEGDNFLANAIETKKKALARAITDALFANAPRELPECLTESDMPAEESENIVYKDSRRNNFYLWRNGKRYEAETIEKLKEILKSKDEDCKSGELEEAKVALTEARSHKLDGFEVRISNRHPGFRSRYFGLTDFKDALALYRKSAQAQAKWEADSRLMFDDRPWGSVSLYGVYGPRSKELLLAEEEYADIPDGSTPGLDSWISKGQLVWPTYESEEDEVIKFADYLKQAVGASESLEEAEGEVCPKCGKSPCECKECADTKLTEASEVIDRKGFATLIKYSDPVFANASHGVLNDGNFCYKFWAKDDDEAKKIFAERGVECDESLRESVKGELDYDEAVNFVEDAGISLDVAGSDFADYIIDDFEALEDENGKFSKVDLKKFIAYAKKKAKEFEEEDLYEDLDTESLDKLISEKLGKTYVTESGYVDGNKITVEGKLGNGPHQHDVKYVFEAKRGNDKVALIGEKFALKGRLENKNIICEDIADSFNEIADGLEEVAGQVRQAADNVEFEAEQVRVGAEEIEGNEGLEEAAKMSEIKGTVGRIIKDKIFPRMGEISTKEELVKVAEEELAGVSDKAKGYAQEVLANLKKKNYSQAAVYLGNVMLAGEGLRSPDAKKEALGEAKGPYDNPNFDEERFGKYFDDNNQLIPELADEYFAEYAKQMKELEEKDRDLEEAHLVEKKWEVRLKSGKALRQAIDGEDGEEIKEALKNCYKEINRKMPEEFDEDELESMLDDLDMADFSENEEVGVDAEEAEYNVNAYLGDFYDFCDGYNIWVEI